MTVICYNKMIEIKLKGIEYIDSASLA